MRLSEISAIVLLLVSSTTINVAYSQQQKRGSSRFKSRNFEETVENDERSQRNRQFDEYLTSPRAADRISITMPERPRHPYPKGPFAALNFDPPSRFHVPNSRRISHADLESTLSHDVVQSGNRKSISVNSNYPKVRLQSSRGSSVESISLDPEMSRIKNLGVPFSEMETGATRVDNLVSRQRSLKSKFTPRDPARDSSQSYKVTEGQSYKRPDSDLLDDRDSDKQSYRVHETIESDFNRPKPTTFRGSVYGKFQPQATRKMAPVVVLESSTQANIETWNEPKNAMDKNSAVQSVHSSRHKSLSQPRGKITFGLSEERDEPDTDDISKAKSIAREVTGKKSHKSSRQNLSEGKREILSEIAPSDQRSHRTYLSTQNPPESSTFGKSHNQEIIRQKILENTTRKALKNSYQKLTTEATKQEERQTENYRKSSRGSSKHSTDKENILSKDSQENSHEPHGSDWNYPNITAEMRKKIMAAHEKRKNSLKAGQNVGQTKDQIKEPLIINAGVDTASKPDRDLPRRPGQTWTKETLTTEKFHYKTTSKPRTRLESKPISPDDELFSHSLKKHRDQTTKPNIPVDSNDGIVNRTRKPFPYKKSPLKTALSEEIKTTKMPFRLRKRMNELQSVKTGKNEDGENIIHVVDAFSSDGFSFSESELKEVAINASDKGVVQSNNSTNGVTQAPINGTVNTASKNETTFASANRSARNSNATEDGVGSNPSALATPTKLITTSSATTNPPPTAPVTKATPKAPAKPTTKPTPKSSGKTTKGTAKPAGKTTPRTTPKPTTTKVTTTAKPVTVPSKLDATTLSTNVTPQEMKPDLGNLTSRIDSFEITNQIKERDTATAGGTNETTATQNEMPLMKNESLSDSSTSRVDFESSNLIKERDEGTNQTTTTPKSEVPFFIYGLYPNGTVVRRFPNGTVVPEPDSLASDQVEQLVEKGDAHDKALFDEIANRVSYKKSLSFTNKTSEPPSMNQILSTASVPTSVSTTETTTVITLLSTGPTIVNQSSSPQITSPIVSLSQLASTETAESATTAAAPPSTKPTTASAKTTTKPTAKPTTKPPAKSTTKARPKTATTAKPRSTTAKPTTPKPSPPPPKRSPATTKVTPTTTRVTSTTASPTTLSTTVPSTTLSTMASSTAATTTTEIPTTTPTTTTTTAKPTTTKPTTTKPTTKKTTNKPTTAKPTTAKPKLTTTTKATTTSTTTKPPTTTSTTTTTTTEPPTTTTTTTEPPTTTSTTTTTTTTAKPLPKLTTTTKATTTSKPADRKESVKATTTKTTTKPPSKTANKLTTSSKSSKTTAKPAPVMIVMPVSTTENTMGSAVEVKKNETLQNRLEDQIEEETSKKNSDVYLSQSTPSTSLVNKSVQESMEKLAEKNRLVMDMIQMAKQTGEFEAEPHILANKIIELAIERAKNMQAISTENPQLVEQNRIGKSLDSGVKAEVTNDGAGDSNNNTLNLLLNNDGKLSQAEILNAILSSPDILGPSTNQIDNFEETSTKKPKKKKPTTTTAAPFGLRGIFGRLNNPASQASSLDENFQMEDSTDFGNNSSPPRRPIRDGLLEAVIEVTRAMSKLMGTMVQEATRSLQSFLRQRTASLTTYLSSSSG